MEMESFPFDLEPFVIAEAGVNHNGSLERAKKLIDIAADSGADAVKFQTFSADRLASRDAGHR
jgi:sialic acid synthase SpsE